jgi:hypothetical protein
VDYCFLFSLLTIFFVFVQAKESLTESGKGSGTECS